MRAKATNFPRGYAALAVLALGTAVTTGTRPATAQSQNVTVNPRTGNLSYVQDDLVLPGGEVSFALRRTYQSRGRGRGQFGWGWSSAPCDVRLQTADQGGRITLYPGDGTWLQFLRSPDGFFRTATGSCDFFSEIVAPAGGRTEYRRECAELGSWAFNAGGWLTAREGPRGGGYRLHRIGGRILRAEVNDGPTLRFTYDDRGRVTRITDGGSRSWVYQYDSRGNLVAVERWPGPVRERYTYDKHHNLVRIERAAGERIELSYTDRDWVAAVKGSDETEVRYAYDAGQPDTYYAVEEQHADTGTQLYEYWPAENRRRLTTNTGVREWTFDEQGRPVQETRPDGTRRQYAYGPDGKLQRITSEHDAEVYAYDPATGNLAGVQRADGQRLAYAYTADGNLEQVSRNGETAATFTYNGAGRIAEVALGDARRMALTYDPLGRLALIALPHADVRIALAYNPTGELAGVDAGGDDAGLAALRAFRSDLRALVQPVSWELIP